MFNYSHISHSSNKYVQKTFAKSCKYDSQNPDIQILQILQIFT